MRWQGGGGYGDPLLRDPQAVAKDVIDGRVSLEAAANVYGVVIGEGVVDSNATARKRVNLYADRSGDQPALSADGERGRSHGARIDDNLVLRPDGEIDFVRCGTNVGDSADYLSRASRRQEPPNGPQITDGAEKYTDREIVYRQLLCPGCGVAFQSEIVPADEEPGRRKWPTVISAI